MSAEEGATRLHTAKRIIVKIGSTLLVESESVRAEWLDNLVGDITRMRRAGQEVVLVSSGAIALGRAKLGPERPRKLEEKQAAAALGQPLLMSALAAAFGAHQISVAQALLTLDDTETRRRWLNARATLETLLRAGAVPIINENDTIATDEIRYGDNDRLAARVAQMLGADLLILLSDVDGLYSADPRRDASAQHIPHLTEITPAYEAMASGANRDAAVGSGGMTTKLMAAKIAFQAGCATVITAGDRPHPIAALHGDARATWIHPPLTPDKAREIWLRGHLTPEGALIVDAGAAHALRQGASLLPVGLVDIDGRFDRGAAVAIKDTSGTTIAKGVTAYSADDAERIKGLQSEAVAETLGVRGRPALVHRDDLVLEP